MMMKGIQGERYTIRISKPEERLLQLEDWEYERLKATDKTRFVSLIECRNRSSSSNRLWAKLLMQNSGELEPDFLLIESTGILFVGVEESIFVLNVSSGKVLFQQKLFAPFLAFYRIGAKSVIALCELEVFVFDDDGRFRWGRSFTDVLSDISMQGDIIEIEELFGDKYQVDALTGRIVNRNAEMVL